MNEEKGAVVENILIGLLIAVILIRGTVMKLIHPINTIKNIMAMILAEKFLQSKTDTVIKETIPQRIKTYCISQIQEAVKPVDHEKLLNIKK